MGQKKQGKPLAVVRKMLSRTYDDLEVKDMSKEAFVNECTSVMVDKMKNKKSNIILPGA